MANNEGKYREDSPITIGYPYIDLVNGRFPLCIVWTPIPILTWVLPFIGHMGICTSTGIIRDFAGSYMVNEDDMAFGKPTKYWRLLPELIPGGVESWDRAVHDASEVYKDHFHNLLCDNCHSMVAMALNKMKYNNTNRWNMVKVVIYFTANSRYTSYGGWFKTWLPFILIVFVGAILMLIEEHIF